MSEEVKEILTGLDKINERFDAIEREVKTAQTSRSSADAEIKRLGNKQVELANALRELEQKADGYKEAEERKTASIGDQFVKSIDQDTFAKYRKVSCEIETKAALTTAASGAGITRNNTVAPMVRPGLLTLPDMPLVIEQLFPHLPTTSNSIEYIREGTMTNKAGIVEEAAQKPETTFTAPSLEAVNVVTIAHWTRVTKQLANDNSALAAYINQKMLYGLQVTVDNQLISGTGGATQLSGMLNASNFTDPLDLVKADLAADATLFDFALLIKSKMESSIFIAPQTFIFNPTDWTKLCLVKDKQGDYILGGPQAIATKSLWGVPVVTSGNMPKGKYLMGNFNLAGTIYDREAINIAMSEEDDKIWRQRHVKILANDFYARKSKLMFKIMLKNSSSSYRTNRYFCAF